MELGLALPAPVLGELGDLALVDVRALDALQLRRAHRREQHVPCAQQRLGAVVVQDHTRVGLRGDGERDPRRDVRLDHPRDHVHPRALRGQHQVDPHRARLLRQPDDRVLDVGGRHHHQVGELVDHAQHVGQRRLAALGPRPVELGQRPRARQRHQSVTLLHLAHEIAQGVGRHARAGDDRREQVRDRLVVGELDLLGVDQDQPHLVRRGAQQDRGEHRVHAAGLARAGGAGHQDVGHLRQVRADRPARHVLALSAATSRPAGPGRRRPGGPSAGGGWAPPRRPPACPGSAPGSGSPTPPARRRCRRVAGPPWTPSCPAPGAARSA